MITVINGGGIHPNELDPYPLFDCRSDWFSLGGGGDHHAFYYNKGLQILALMQVNGMSGDLWSGVPTNLYYVQDDSVLDLGAIAVTKFQKIYQEGTVQELQTSGVLKGTATQLK